MTTKNVNFLLAGVGGQGTLLASDILAEVGLHVGLDAKKSEVHGMSQRGGVVTSHVRWGEKVYSPLCEKGKVDILIAQELLEALRFVDYLRPGGTAILSHHRIPPTSTVFGSVPYPAEDQVMQAFQERAGKVLLIDAVEIAEQMGNRRAANTVLLGALASQLDVPMEAWLEVVLARVPQKYKEVNRKAFMAGYEGQWELSRQP